MGRKGQREKFLEEVCHRLYGVGKRPKHRFKSALESSDRYAEICDVYKALGGIMDSPKLSPGSWDIITQDFIIELDEENHFNHYRAITLNAPLYKDYKNFDVSEYLRYCEDKKKEDKCVKYGSYWKTKTSDLYFGESSKKGDMSGNGPSRWKQRAFYDYLKDVYSVVTGIPVIRISIYEEFGDTTVGQNLENQDVEKTKEYLRKRIKIKKQFSQYSEL